MNRLKKMCMAGLVVLNSTPAFSETRKECELSLHPNTNLVVGGGAGTIVGKVIAAPVCLPLLTSAPVDLGLSAGLCVLIVTLAGTAAGTAVAESTNHESLKQCDALAE